MHCAREDLVKVVDMAHASLQRYIYWILNVLHGGMVWLMTMRNLRKKEVLVHLGIFRVQLVGTIWTGYKVFWRSAKVLAGKSTLRNTDHAFLFRFIRETQVEQSKTRHSISRLSIALLASFHFDPTAWHGVSLARCLFGRGVSTRAADMSYGGRRLCGMGHGLAKGGPIAGG